jgi:LacI family transcriptional regulator
MATIKDVAKKAGVSPATVSRIINGDKTYKTTDETRDRVWKIVRELNYVPNQAAKSLSFQKGRSSPYQDYKIGCLLCVTTEKYSDPYYMAILSGLEAKLSQEGLSLSLLRTTSELEDRTVFLNLLSQKLSGMIIMESLSEDMYKQIKDNVQHLVGIDTIHRDIDNICYDRFEAAEKAVSYLIEKGHRRIGYLGSCSSGDIRKEKRYRGYLSALNEAGIEEDLSIVKDTKWSRKQCYKSTLEILDSGDPPTAIFAASDLMGLVAINAIYEKGLSVPDDIAVIGVSNIEMAKYSNPPLSTIDVPKKEMGVAAAEQLLYRLKGSDSPPRTIILPTNLIVRESTEKKSSKI